MAPTPRQQTVSGRRDAFADTLFSTVEDVSGRLVGRPVAEVVTELRGEVRNALMSFRPDGSWPETELLMEVMAAFVGVADAVLADRGLTLVDLSPADQRWLDACRQCTMSPELLDDMLASLRPELGRAGYSGR